MFYKHSELYHIIRLDASSIYVHQYKVTKGRLDDIMKSCEAIISPPAMFSVLGFPHKVAGLSLTPRGESVGFGNVKFHLSWVIEFHSLIEQL